MTLNTIALELVPSNLDSGAEKAYDEARRVKTLSAAVGLDGRIGHIMIRA